MKISKTITAPIVLALGLSLSSCAQDEPKEEWVSLFNGENLDGWTIKFKGHPVGVNYKNTFQVNDGAISVNYDEYENFDQNFGHIFYKDQFSDYILKLEYRMTGTQVPGGPGWAYKNNGIMVHSQSAESMGLDQPFPRSIEVQLLNGDDTGERRNGNVCTPGTHIVMNGELITEHCIDSNSETTRGESWVEVEVEVRNSEVIRHKINGQLVLEYNAPQIDVTDGETPVEGIAAGTLLKEGYIAFQAESHPTEFRNIRLKKLN